MDFSYSDVSPRGHFSEAQTSEITEQPKIIKKCFKPAYSSSMPIKKRIVEGAGNTQDQDLLWLVLDNLKLIDERIAKIENNMADKYEVMAQNKLLRECKVTVKKIEQSVCRMTGEIKDEQLDSIASILPFESVEAILDAEEKLKTPEYTQAMTTYIVKMKGVSNDIDSVIRKIFSDKVLQLFNWDGRWEKRPLVKLVLVDQILCDIFKAQGRMQFEKSIKKSIELSHNRIKQKKYQNNKKE